MKIFELQLNPLFFIYQKPANIYYYDFENSC